MRPRTGADSIWPALLMTGAVTALLGYFVTHVSALVPNLSSVL